MGWGLGYDNRYRRFIGYLIPAFCDHPGCKKEIDRGLAFVCAEQELYGGDKGCGLYFCEDHRNQDGFCERCQGGAGLEPYEPKPEHPEWIHHVLSDESWKQWREENPEETDWLKGQLPEQPEVESERSDSPPRERNYYNL